MIHVSFNHAAHGGGFRNDQKVADKSGRRKLRHSSRVPCRRAFLFARSGSLRRSPGRQKRAASTGARRRDPLSQSKGSETFQPPSLFHQRFRAKLSARANAEPERRTFRTLAKSSANRPGRSRSPRPAADLP